MLTRASGRVVTLLAAFAAAASTSAGAGQAAPAPANPTLAFRTTALAGAGVRRLERRRWRTQRYVTASGAAVRVSLSPAYGSDATATERWADFFASLVHGTELADLNAYVAPLAEVQAICGGKAYGCYGSNRLITMGETNGGVTAASVATHEYGHHIAFHRLNPPWSALNSGTKRWATMSRICARTAAGTAFPGAEDARYPLNPGEAFAEAYRVMIETQAGLPLTWPIIDPSFAPDAVALEAVREDVLQPWLGPTKQTVRGRFARGNRTWTLKLAAPLDGSVSVRVTGAVGDVQLLAEDGRTILAQGTWTPTGAKSIEYVDCGRRSLAVRVRRGGSGRSFRLDVSIP